LVGTEVSSMDWMLVADVRSIMIYPLQSAKARCMPRSRSCANL
jgi:hypothetical protein